MHGKQRAMRRSNYYFVGLATTFLYALTLVSCNVEGAGEQAEHDLSDRLKVSAEKKQEYLEKGMRITTESFKALSNKLKKSIKEDGLEGAIATCNIHAAPAVDSLGRVYEASIKRTALRTRNPANKPSDQERHLLKLYERAYGADEELKPIILIPDSENVLYYSPITMQPLCMTCHGEPGVSMKEELYEQIVSLYPTDKAVGYMLGEFRGMWAIKFKQ